MSVSASIQRKGYALALSPATLTILIVGGGILLSTRSCLAPHPVGLTFYLFTAATLMVTTTAWMRLRLADDFYRNFLLSLLWIVFLWRVTQDLRVYQSYGLPFTMLLVGLITSMGSPLIRFYSLLSALTLEALTAYSLALSTGEVVARVVSHGLCVAFFFFLLPRRRLGRMFLPTTERGLRSGTQLPSVAAISADQLSESDDFGLLSRKLPPDTHIPSLKSRRPESDQERSALTFLKTHFDLELEQLMSTLGLDTAILLWRVQGEQSCAIRAINSKREQWLPGPYSIDGHLQRGFQHQLVLDHPFSSGELPYYPRGFTIGSAVLTPIPRLRREGSTQGLLCVDRSAEGRWSPQLAEALELSARKICLSLEIVLRLKALARERNAVERLCTGLKAFNHALTVQEVIDAAMEAIRLHGDIDLIAFCVMESSEAPAHYQIRQLWRSPQLMREPQQLGEGMELSLQEGLAGEVLRKERIALSGNRTGTSKPIFHEHDGLSQLRSSLLLPLRGQSSSYTGCLVLASSRGRAFDYPHAEPMELIAEQVSVKLQLAQVHERMQYFAEHDGLTFLKNHRVFQEELARLMTESDEQGQIPLSLLLLDIDFFKQVNDTFGHQAGDLVLQEVASELLRLLPSAALAARYGGEEFAVILWGATEADAFQCAELLRQEISHLEIEWQRQRVMVTLSLGVATCPTSARRPEELIKEADRALYQAKERGRNQTVCATELVSDSGPGWTGTYHRDGVLPPGGA